MEACTFVVMNQYITIMMSCLPNEGAPAGTDYEDLYLVLSNKIGNGIHDIVPVNKHYLSINLGQVRKLVNTFSQQIRGRTMWYLPICY
jgi:hypothetical protein